MNVQILHLELDVGQKPGGVHLKMFQDIRRLLIDLPCPPRLIFISCYLALQRGICDRRTDRVCVRVLMPYYVYFSCFFIHNPPRPVIYFKTRLPFFYALANLFNEKSIIFFE